MNKDLTVGSPSKVLWQFCLPMFGSILFQQLYNIADSLVAGKLICGQQLRDHSDLSGVLIRLQHRRFCHCFPIFRRKGL